MVQCSTRDLKVVSSILAHGSFLVRSSTLSLTIAELRGLWLLSSGDYLINLHTQFFLYGNLKSSMTKHHNPLLSHFSNPLSLSLSFSHTRTFFTSPVCKEPDGYAYRPPGHLLRHCVEEDDGAGEHHITQHTHHGHQAKDAPDVRSELFIVHLRKECGKC